MKKYVFISLILMLVSCEKESTPDLFFYNETGCSDAWWEDAPQIDTLTPEIYEEWVANYLESKNVEVFSFQITYDSAVAELCMACDCKTGRVLELEVESGKRRKMRQLGFYQ